MKRSADSQRAGTKPRKASAPSLPSWKLQDAKARFSELIREVQQRGPQRVTVHGKDAVVVVSAEEYARLAPVAAQPSLHALLSRSPLRDLDFEHESVQAPVRDVEL